MCDANPPAASTPSASTTRAPSGGGTATGWATARPSGPSSASAGSASGSSSWPGPPSPRARAAPPASRWSWSRTSTPPTASRVSRPSSACLGPSPRPALPDGRCSPSEEEEEGHESLATEQVVVASCRILSVGDRGWGMGDGERGMRRELEKKKSGAGVLEGV